MIGDEMPEPSTWARTIRGIALEGIVMEDLTAEQSEGLLRMTDLAIRRLMARCYLHAASECEYDESTGRTVIDKSRLERIAQGPEKGEIDGR